MAVRDDLGRWLFERDYQSQGLCSAYDARWEEWVERNREEWKQEADALVERICSLLDDLDPVEVALSGVDAVKAYLRGQLTDT